ncbi:MAG: hypothetical protein R3183_14135 [Oleiphilaceae bacterium]|nr:hypothetical protein [Oleiphilaceae bacterium]
MLKWIALSLLVLNVLLAAFQWYQVRTVKVGINYKEVSGAQPLVLLRDSMSKAEQGDERCVLLGPFDDPDQLTAVQEALVSDGFTVEAIEQPLKKAPSYWVYDGPFESESERLARYREFQEKNIDSFIIRQGELAGQISVGVFENIDSAKRMLTQMRNKGYRVNMKPISRKRTAFWMLVSRSESIVSEEKIRSFFNGLKVVSESRQIFCKSVASPKHLP